jgi:EAL domain-containing protein (putative c-di-GMP-specific phosphodiesterase class I)
VPLDVLKVDAALLGRVDRDRRARALLEAVVHVAAALGMDVVAEGVETPAQLTVLSALGCGFVQGFVISRPVAPARLRELVDAGALRRWPGLVATP